MDYPEMRPNWQPTHLSHFTLLVAQCEHPFRVVDEGVRGHIGRTPHICPPSYNGGLYTRVYS